MKNQMIKLSVIAAVLSAMTFAAGAATTPSTNQILNLTANVTKGSCSVTPATPADLNMNWPELVVADFANAADLTTGITAEAKTVKLTFASCNTDLLAADSIDLVATQTSGATDLTNDGLWGDDDTTGVGFIISGKQPAGNATVLKPNNNKMPIVTAGNANDAENVAPADVTLTVTPTNRVANTAITNGKVAAVVTLAAVYQ